MYALANPVRLIDPWGEDPVEAKPGEETGYKGTRLGKVADAFSDAAGKVSEGVDESGAVRPGMAT